MQDPPDGQQPVPIQNTASKIQQEQRGKKNIDDALRAMQQLEMLQNRKYDNTCQQKPVKSSASKIHEKYQQSINKPEPETILSKNRSHKPKKGKMKRHTSQATTPKNVTSEAPQACKYRTRKKKKDLTNEHNINEPSCSDGESEKLIRRYIKRKCEENELLSSKNSQPATPNHHTSEAPRVPKYRASRKTKFTERELKYQTIHQTSAASKMLCLSKFLTTARKEYGSQAAEEQISQIHSFEPAAPRAPPLRVYRARKRKQTELQAPEHCDNQQKNVLNVSAEQPELRVTDAHNSLLISTSLDALENPYKSNNLEQKYSKQQIDLDSKTTISYSQAAKQAKFKRDSLRRKQKLDTKETASMLAYLKRLEYAETFQDDQFDSATIISQLIQDNTSKMLELENSYPSFDGVLPENNSVCFHCSQPLYEHETKAIPKDTLSILAIEFPDKQFETSRVCSSCHADFSHNFVPKSDNKIEISYVFSSKPNS